MAKLTIEIELGNDAFGNTYMNDGDIAEARRAEVDRGLSSFISHFGFFNDSAPYFIYDSNGNKIGTAKMEE